MFCLLITRKKELNASGVDWIERSADRLQGRASSDNLDDIDREAHVKLERNNMILPVEVSS